MDEPIKNSDVETPRKRRGPKPGRRHSGQFVPGQSGNPGGRNKADFAFRQRCAELTRDLVLPAWIEEVKTKGPAWIKAAEMISAYGLGKPREEKDDEPTPIESTQTFEIQITPKIQP